MADSGPCFEICKAVLHVIYFLAFLQGEADFSTVAIEVTFDGGNSTLPVAIEIEDDLLAEGMEAFTVRLGLPLGRSANRILTGLNQSTVFIEDDDGT